IVFTSGTTSMSKGAMLTHRNYASNIYGMNQMIEFLPTDVNMAFLPFHHTLGSTGLMMMLSAGVMNVFCDGIKYIQPNLKEYKVSVFVCVPLLLEAIYKKIMAEVDRQGKTKLINIMSNVCNGLLKVKIDIRRKIFKQILDNLGGEIRLVISGAAPIDKNVAQGYYNFGITTLQGYGLTETAPVLAGENKSAIRFGSCGFPLANVELKIDEPNEEGIGEIIAKGPNVMVGYYENQEATNEVIKNGWFHTGDLGRIDDDGFVFITGRKKNVIVLKNGKNIYPEELEMLVASLPYVQENMVYGKPKGDDVLLSVKIVYNEEYTNEKYPGKSEEELRDIAWKDVKDINAGLPQYKRMKNLVFTKEEMVKTTTRKVKRFEEIKKEDS
ncbi:MAG: AMP-binding protein, partial [Oscillospiraceae bacterium]|nr:AMP-binding protein [Oscillospiraceae bacterium]